MSIATLSPVSPEPPSSKLMFIRDVEPSLHPANAPVCPDVAHQSLNRASSLGPESNQSNLTSEESTTDPVFSQRTKKPPPLHTGADWKVVLHLPEIEKWLRATSDRVAQLTHSVGQDGDNRHVDVHLVQLKDICEDISDHVEQIHALLETEFSLKLLSYSVNIIVDIRTVQLLWHQLRVSVLVLKERLLQGLQDPNGNYTRQTDILQAFSQDQHQTRLDALTEVDDCGQLTIRCSQDYFSLDCGITAFELSDYSPSDHPEDRGTESTVEDTSQDIIHTTNSNLELHKNLPPPSLPSDIDNHSHSTPQSPTNQSDMPKYSESSKRSLQAVSHSTESSPTQPSLPKRAALFSNKGAKSRGSFRKARLQSDLQHKAELSQSTPSLVDPPDRSKFWLELDSVDLRNLPQSSESLQRTIEHNLKNHHVSSTHRKPEGSSGTNVSLPVCRLMSLDEISTQTERRQKRTYTVSMGDSDSSLPSPISEKLQSSDLEASGEESDAQRGGSRNAGWTVNRKETKKGSQVLSERIQSREHWYGSDEFLALPSQLHETEMLAVKLESLIQSSTMNQRGLQDVDDWELSEINMDWNTGESGVNTRNIVGSGDYSPSPLLSLHPHRQTSVSYFSSSSSDVAPSLEDSIESGPLSDLLSGEEQSRRSVDGSTQLTTPLADGCGCASLMKKLLEDIQDQNEGIWVKMECFVQKLDGFISWLQEALDSTENWTQPRQDLDSLRVYLDTHLTFKLNVDSQHALKESIVAEGKALLSVITSHQMALKDILHMVGSQWDQLQWQIRRQHGWMLRALRCIQTRLLYTSHSQQPCASTLDLSANGQFPCLAEDVKVERNSTQCNIQQVALETMSVRLRGLHYPSSSRRYNRSSSLQEFEAEYQELWEWLMDMDAMVTDSHQLMMSEEQRHHLFKSSLAELLMMESRKTSLIRQTASLKRSGTELPSDLHIKIHNLTHTWQQLEKILSEHSVPCSSEQKLSSNVNTLLVAGQAVAAESPRSALSPMTNSLLEQLEARIKELKAWLRDTELLIFNSCLRQETGASEQLSSFKSLCSEIGSRRRGVASVLKLCQKLLQQSQSGLMGDVGPDAEQHREALQLLSINLERRWEAIVMQALQWQNRLKRELGEQQVNGNILETGLVDLHQISPVSVASVTVPPEDFWEWDETDMLVMEAERLDVPQPDLTTNLPTALQSTSNNILANDNQPVEIQTDIQATQLKELSNLKDGASMDVNSHSPPNNNVYQVFSLHSIELCKQPVVFPLPPTLMHINKPVKNKEHFLLKSISKDSSLSSIESLPDLLGGLMSSSQQRDRISEFCNRESEGGRRSGQSENSLRSDCESGIVSDNGDSETSSNSGVQGKKEDQGIERQEKRDRRKGEITREHYSLALEKNCITPYKKSKKQISTNLEELRRNELRCEIKRNKEEKKRFKQGGGEAVEILINGHGILTPANSDSDIDVKGLDDSKMFMSQRDNTECNPDHYNSSETPPALNSRTSSPVLSQSSSLESLLALGIDLFPSKERLHHSVSLESCLNPCHSPDREAVGSLTSPDQMNQGQDKDQDIINLRANMDTKTEASSGELSQRTLDLLKRLENIQNPLVGKMTRSVSDMSIQSSIPQKNHFPVSPSLGGQHTPLSRMLSTSWKGQPSTINENLSKISLTELSSTEDSSLGSEDFVVLRNQHPLFLDPNIGTSSSPHMTHCHNGNRGGKSVDESDAASLSMVVNVSCTSACTDEDDSDLLSSSTLTLTEEELGVRDEQDGDDDRVDGVSSGNEEDDDNDEDDMETSYELGLEYMKRELQSWIRPPRTSVSSSFKSEAGLLDELQCGSAPPSTFPCSRAQLMDTSNKAGGNTNRKEREDETRLNVTRSYIIQFVDDVENGNIDHSCLQGKDEDDELLQEESGFFTQKRDTLRDFYVNTKTEDRVEDVGNLRVEMDSVSTSHIGSPSSELHPFSSKHISCLVGELRGELPCHNASLPSPPLLSPVNCRSHNALDNNLPIAGGRKAITIQEKFKFSSLVTEETRREVRAKDSSLPSKKGHKSHASCCSPFLLSASPLSLDESKKENVHDFVMEIIDMTSVALKSKENQSDGATQRETSGSVPDQSSTSLAHIRDKVLEHSHRPLHLRKGDFYSYLSLSSHDSDCGEVSQCAEDKSLTPVPYSIPSYCTSTPTPNSPSPELFPNTKVAMSSFQSAQLSRCSSPSLTAKEYSSLDLKCFDGEPASVSDGSIAEQQSSSPSLSVPTSPDFRNEETLFEACTEEVYLGPPLCYSMVIKNKPQPSYHKLCLETSLAGGCELNENAPCLSQEGKSSKLDDRQTDHLFSTQSSGSTNETQNFYRSEPCYSLFSTSSLLRSNFSSLGHNLFSPLPVSTEAMEEKLGEDLYLASDGVVGKVAAAVSVSTPEEERSRNEGPSYLNPWVRVALIDSFATECLADTKTLESNMGTVMTKISVCSSATNPSKEPATAATRINPKINCSAMRRLDREEGKRSKEADTQRAEEEEKRRKGWSASQQEAKSALVKQAGFWPVLSHSVGATQDEANPQ